MEQAKTEILALKSKSGVADNGLTTTGTDVTELLFLRTALDHLARENELAENKLEQVTTEFLALEAERDIAVRDRDDLKHFNKIVQSELISQEEELCRLKEYLEDVRKQMVALASSKAIGLESLQTRVKLLGIGTAANVDTVDQECIRGTKTSATELSLEGNTVPEWEDESRIIEIQTQLVDFNVGTDRSNPLAINELDDMKRVNRSLRDDLEAISEEKYALEKELEARCDDFNELNEDVEKFAEAFAVQHAELLKLQAENKKLKELSQNY